MNDIPAHTEEEQMYRENVLDYYKHPRNKERLPNPTIQHRELNPLCGDDITIYVQVEDNKITKATFTGQGCAISQAAVSMLTEKLVGKTVKEAEQLTKEDIVKMLGITISPGRIKCALLCLKATVKGIQSYGDKK